MTISKDATVREGRYIVDIRRRAIGYSGTYTFTDYGGLDLQPTSGWWRPTRRWIERTMRRVAT